MATDYERRQITSRRIEYFLKTPATGADIDYVLNRVIDDARMPAGLKKFDDAVTVKVTDDGILFSFNPDWPNDGTFDD